MDTKRYYMLDDLHFFYATNDKGAKPKRRIPIADIISVNQLPDNISNKIKGKKEEGEIKRFYMLSL